MEKEILIERQSIQHRVNQLAVDIALEHHESNNPLPPVFVCVLNGGFMFFNDLIRALRKHRVVVEVDFIRIKSYNGRDNSNGPTIIKDFEVDLKGKRVYIIDDMCETGTTLIEAVSMASSRVPADVKIVTMIERTNGKQLSDHVGFTIETNQWLVGYGLDNNQLERTLEDIYTIN